MKEGTPKNGKKKLLYFVLIVLLILVLNHVSGISAWISDTENLNRIGRFFEDNKAAAFFIYCVITVFACVLLALPGVTFALFAGMLFGPVLGIFACLLACTIGASLAFLAGRFFLKDAVKPMLEKNRLLKKLLFSNDGKSETVVLMITRLVPLFPYNLQNFAYGITDIGFWKYTSLTFLFMFPGVSFFTIGAAGLTAGEDKWKYFLLAGVLAVLVTLLGLFIKKKYLGSETEPRKQAYVIMTRLPVAGRTKTRLMPFLSGEECKKLHEAFLYDLSDNLAGIDAEVIVYYSDDCEDAFSRAKAYFPQAAHYIRQEGDGLGARMLHAFFEAKARGYERTVLTGTDIPELSAALINEAFSALSGHEIVLSATEDGGYYLVGMREPENIFDIGAYGTQSVYERTLEAARKSGLRVREGKVLSDLDTKEDFLKLSERYAEQADLYGQPYGLWKRTAAFLRLKTLAADCIGCDLCKRHCVFLQKYAFNLRGFSESEGLWYHCFLCDRCLSDCPKDISGRAIALTGRRAMIVANDGTLSEKGYGGLLWEKDPYRFANYKSGHTKSVLWTGCNFKAFFPKTEKKLRALLKAHGIGIIHDCCGKPVWELGLAADAERNLREISEKLDGMGVTELIMVCPNCYYYMRGRLPEHIRLTTIYEKLSELGLGKKISPKTGGGAEAAFPLYLPCPDRTEQIFRRSAEAFLSAPAELETFSELQCCGLGGCATAKEPELVKKLSENACAYADGALYTYCASCVSQFRRNGFAKSYHLLPLILETEEPLPGGIRPFLNRAASLVERG